MQSQITTVAILLIAVFALGCQSRVIAPRERAIDLKVFNYQGALPIKDDRTGEIVQVEDDDTIPMIETSSNKTVDEAACWNLIVDQSAVTFALQNRALDELMEDMKDLEMDEALRDNINKLTARMKSSMQDAIEALDSESPEEYFDSLFDTSESIVIFSSLIRDPKLDEKVFLVLVKAISRLGRNNSALVQGFIDNCSMLDRSQPRPRMLPR